MDCRSISKDVSDPHAKERSNFAPKSAGPVISQPPSSGSDGMRSEEGSDDTGAIKEMIGSRSSSSSGSVSSSGGSSYFGVESDEDHGPEKSPLREEASSLILGGCTRCHMYVMLQKENPRCPRCDCSDLVSFFHERTNE